MQVSTEFVRLGLLDCVLERQSEWQCQAVLQNSIYLLIFLFCFTGIPCYATECWTVKEYHIYHIISDCRRIPETVLGNARLLHGMKAWLCYRIPIPLNPSIQNPAPEHWALRFFRVCFLRLLARLERNAKCPAAHHGLSVDSMPELWAFFFWSMLLKTQAFWHQKLNKMVCLKEQRQKKKN